MPQPRSCCPRPPICCPSLPHALICCPSVPSVARLPSVAPASQLSQCSLSRNPKKRQKGNPKKGNPKKPQETPRNPKKKIFLGSKKNKKLIFFHIRPDSKKLLQTFKKHVVLHRGGPLRAFLTSSDLPKNSLFVAKKGNPKKPQEEEKQKVNPKKFLPLLGVPFCFLGVSWCFLGFLGVPLLGVPFFLTFLGFRIWALFAEMAFLHRCGAFQDTASQM